MWHESTKEGSPNGETVTLTHSLGTIDVLKNPQRVVVLDYSALENRFSWNKASCNS